MLGCLLVIGVSLGWGAELPESRADAAFWAHWGDGQAEVAGYRLTQPRYGLNRPGEAVLIWVTETFTLGQRLKSDGGHDDEFPVIKLNDVRSFQTGAYDYHVMSSVFTPLDGRSAVGVPTKVSFSSQEWCGQVWDQLVVDPGRMRRVGLSYFDGEGERGEQFGLPKGALFQDEMAVLVRGLGGEALAPGETRQVTVVPRLMDLRFEHRPLVMGSGVLGRAAETHVLRVPAGEFLVQAWTLTVGDFVGTWEVEVAAPHRLIAWHHSSGEAAELTGVVRTRYWQQNAPGGEALRAKLGLGEPSWMRSAAQ